MRGRVLHEDVVDAVAVEVYAVVPRSAPVAGDSGKDVPFAADLVVDRGTACEAIAAFIWACKRWVDDKHQVPSAIFKWFSRHHIIHDVPVAVG